MTMPATLEGPEHPPHADPHRRRPRALRAGCLADCADARRRSAPRAPALLAVRPRRARSRGLAGRRRGAPRLHAFEFRYQYLAGGVNTGTAGPPGTLTASSSSWYIADSAGHRAVSVFPYYMLLQSNPATGGSEQAKDISNLANPATMAPGTPTCACSSAGRRLEPVILHVEPDLWGYIEQATAMADDATQIPASVSSSGDAALAGLPNTAAGFAQAIVRLRDQLAPNVLLAYHLSVWGTNRDITYSNSSDAQVDAWPLAPALLPVAWRLVRPDVHRHRATAMPSSSRSSTAMAAPHGGTTPTSSATRASSRASSPAPGIASSSGRSRWATPGCAP